MGRPRVEGIDREPNGRRRRSTPVDSKEALENKSVVLAQRAKLGLNEDEARDQRALTFIGRLNLRYHRDGGKSDPLSLSDEQYREAQDMQRSYNAYQRAIGSKPEYQEKPENAGASAGDPLAYERFCTAAVSAWDARRKTVSQHMQEVGSPNGSEFIRLCVLQDYELPHLVRAGKALLSALLVSHERKERREAA
jgi:hypothetical protein